MTKKREIIGSKEMHSLYEDIRRDPNHEEYGVSDIPTSRFRGTIVLIVTFSFLVPLLFTYIWFGNDPETFWIAWLSLATFFSLGLSCMFYVTFADAGYNRIILNETGIAKEIQYHTLKGRPTGTFEYYAIEWQDVENVEIKQKGEKIHYIKFRDERKTVYTGMSRGSRNLTLAIVRIYLPDLETWATRPLIGEKHVIVYYSPTGKDAQEIENIQPGEEYQSDAEIIEAIGEDDFEVYYKTQEVKDSLEEEDLFNQIESDPTTEVVVNKTRLRWMANNPFKSFILLIITITVLLFITLQDFISQEIRVVLVVHLFVLPFLFMILIPISLGVKKIVLNYKGIGSKGIAFTGAIEWEHVEFVTITIVDGKILSLHIVGNRREIILNRNPADYFTIDILGRYLPGFGDWTTSSRDEWGEETTRYHRPDY
jgi:hypothetical protein